jgi:hypothetical protein
MEVLKVEQEGSRLYMKVKSRSTSMLNTEPHPKISAVASRLVPEQKEAEEQPWLGEALSYTQTTGPRKNNVRGPNDS